MAAEVWDYFGFGVGLSGEPDENRCQVWMFGFSGITNQKDWALPEF